MDMQIITNSVSSIKISKQDALKLELEINLYNNKDFWIEIGDQLYNFHSKNINLPIMVENIKFVSILEVLKKLNIKYQEY
tara:strand:- start:1504 stop:1743 length:240 start_codon:yes stop_codon:yes gene_type:complete